MKIIQVALVSPLRQLAVAVAIFAAVALLLHVMPDSNDAKPPVLVGQETQGEAIAELGDDVKEMLGEASAHLVQSYEKDVAEIERHTDVAARNLSQAALRLGVPLPVGARLTLNGPSLSDDPAKLHRYESAFSGLHRDATLIEELSFALAISAPQRAVVVVDPQPFQLRLRRSVIVPSVSDGAELQLPLDTIAPPTLELSRQL